MNRTGELWEHLGLRYLVVKRTKSGTGWHAIRLHDYYDSERGAPHGRAWEVQRGLRRIA